MRIIAAQPQVSHAGPSAGRAPRGGTEMIPLRCQVKSGQVRSSQVKSGQVRSSQVKSGQQDKTSA